MDNSFNRIATAIAFSPRLKANLNESVRIAEKLGATLILIHVGKKEQKKEKHIQYLLAKIGMKEHPKIVWKEGKPVEVITAVSWQLKIDLIIAGALINETLYRYYVGSIARKLTRKVNCSLLLLTQHSDKERFFNKVVINGIAHPKTSYTIKRGIEFAKKIQSKQVHIVEEVDPKVIKIVAKDSKSVKKADYVRARIRKRETLRVQELLREIDTENLAIQSKCIFGKSGYSIGHYSQNIKADLLVMNDFDRRFSLIDRIFIHDLEYILSDLPCDLLVIKKELES